MAMNRQLRRGACWIVVASAVASTSFLNAAVASAAIGRACSLEVRLAAQNRLFDEEASAEAGASPETLTANGDFRRNWQLDDRSATAQRSAYGRHLRFQVRLEQISTEGFSDEDLISHQLLMDHLAEQIADYRLKTYEMNISPIGGVHVELATLPTWVPLDTVPHYEDYIRRLRDIPGALNQTITVLRKGEKDGLVPPRALVEQLGPQCDAIIASNPFASAADHLPSGFSSADRARLAKAIRSVSAMHALPAYRRLSHFLRGEYLSHSRASMSESTLPNGAALYQQEIRRQTTTNMTPAQIHSLGLSEVARINRLLAQVARNAGFPSLAAYRLALDADPRYRPTSSDQIVEDFRHHVDQMKPLLPRLFNDIPDTRMTVAALPEGERPDITHHVDGSADGSRPGQVLVATSDYAHRSLIGDETVAYHEGLPGHELQISIQQRLTGLPAFRSDLRNNAYVEGWAVYAEALGKDVGLFSDPASDYGRLNTELLRAVRLVVDTGIHADGWSRDQAVAYFRASGAADEPRVQAEMDVSMTWPAKALAYKIGQLKILELRERAESKLGEKFDIRRFHDAVLDSGSLPLDVLEAKIDRWIASQLIENS